MTIGERIKNLWHLSDYGPEQPSLNIQFEHGTVPALLVKKPEKAKFVPRIVKDPIKELINEPIK